MDQVMDFDSVYHTYWKKVFRLCKGYTNSEVLAEDLTQEIFVKIWQQLPKLRVKAALGTWVFRIATNVCLREIKREKKRLTEDLPYQIKDNIIKPNTAHEKVALLHQYIAELKEVDRIIIALILEGLSQKDVASIVGISEGNIRVRTHRIKKALALKFKKNG